MNRWEHLLDLRPVSLIEHLLEEAAKILASELQTWPLPIQDMDETSFDAFASYFTADAPRPDRRAYVQAFRLTDWELGREFDAIDDYMRNRRWMSSGLTMEDKRVVLLISRWLVEHLLSLSEATEGRVKRPQLRDLLARLEKRFLSPGAQPA